MNCGSPPESHDAAGHERPHLCVGHFFSALYLGVSNYRQCDGDGRGCRKRHRPCGDYGRRRRTGNGPRPHPQVGGRDSRCSCRGGGNMRRRVPQVQTSEKGEGGFASVRRAASRFLHRSACSGDGVASCNRRYREIQNILSFGKADDPMIPIEIRIHSFWPVWAGTGAMTHSRRIVEAIRGGGESLPGRAAGLGHRRTNPRTQHMNRTAVQKSKSSR